MLTYHFVSLESLADYLATRSDEIRSSAGSKHITQTKAKEKLAEANAYLMIADMVRNTKIGERDDQT